MWDVKYVLPLLFPVYVDCKGEAGHFLLPFHHYMEVVQHSDTDHIEVAIDMGNLVGKPAVGHELLSALR